MSSKQYVHTETPLCFVEIEIKHYNGFWSRLVKKWDFPPSLGYPTFLVINWKYNLKLSLKVLLSCWGFSCMQVSNSKPYSTEIFMRLFWLYWILELIAIYPLPRWKIIELLQLFYCFELGCGQKPHQSTKSSDSLKMRISTHDFICNV